METKRRWVHRLSEINPENRTAVCAECGPVRLKPKKRGTSWACGKAAQKWAGKKRPLRDWTKTQIEERERLRIEQGNKCAICGHELVGLGVTDHCHKTLVIRGVLCQQCNSGLGFFRDDPERLEAAATYLRRYLSED